MSVVSRRSRRRWVVVAAGVVVAGCLPSLTSSATAWWQQASGPASTAPSPRALVTAALASASIPHSGLAQSTGDLGLPDLPRLGDVAAQLGGTTRTRVWWAGSDDWRVDVVTPTGEQGTYDNGGRLALWDYEQARLTTVVGESPVRLPRADDLLPPQAARRLLAGVGPGDRELALPGRRQIAGRTAYGVRIVPGDVRSTIGHIDVWLDAGDALPLQVTVVDARGVIAVQSEFLDLDLRPPGPSEVTIPAAPGAVHDTTQTPDLVARIQRFGAWVLPASLAGLPASQPLVGGTQTYGTGLVRFVVLPLSPRLADEVLDATRTGGGTPLNVTGGEALTVHSGVLNLVIGRSTDRTHAYLVAGLVSPQVVTTATQQLLAHPPPRRTG